MPHIRRGDFDGDGRMTPQDIMTFLGAFFAGRLDANVTGSGTLAIGDVFTFINSWFAG